MMTDATATRVALFLIAFVSWLAAHYVADHWLQSDDQAAHKGDAGWKGHLACSLHVGTYVLVQAFAVYAAAWKLGLVLPPVATLAGLVVSGVTHYIADRRAPLRAIAKRMTCAGFVDVKGGGINGAYLLDQSWHIGWIFVAALVAAG